MDMHTLEDFQGPVPSNIERALRENNQNTHPHRQLYLSGHSAYNSYLDCMSLTQAGRDYHVKLIMGMDR